MSAAIIAVAMVGGFVVFHRVDGGEVLINPAQVTSIRNPEGRYRNLIPVGRCIIDLTDRKFIMVAEPCAEVRKMLEGLQ